MQFDEHLAALASESAALAATALLGLDAPVPPCPGWTVRDLVVHTGRVQRRKAATVLRRSVTEPSPDELPDPQAPDDEALPGWFLQGADELVRALASAGPELPSWSWAGDHRAAFWARRLAQETAVHRWDAEAAGTSPAPVEPVLAADGIDEFLRLWLPRPDRGWRAPAATLHVHCIDTPGEWMVDLSDSPAVRAEHGKADVALRGEASDLLLVLWRRLPLERVEVLGDPRLAERVVAHAELG